MGLNNKNNKKAFTLAEVMVVLLVLSLITAAFLPVMTQLRKKGGGGDKKDLWIKAGNGTDVYYGADTGAQDVIMGIDQFDGGDVASKVLINTLAVGQNSVLFKEGAVTTGRMVLDSRGNVGLGNVTLGSFTMANNSDPAIDNAVAFGNLANATATRANAIGYNTSASTDGVALGSSVEATGTNSVAIGPFSKTVGTDSIAIGNSAGFSANTESLAIAIGAKTASTGIHSIAIGGSDTANNSASATLDYALAIGYKAKGLDSTGFAIGPYATSRENLSNIAIGDSAMGVGITAGYGYNAAVGYQAAQNLDSGDTNVAIGSQAFSLATGQNNSTAIGYKALYSGSHVSAGIGSQACMDNANMLNTCIGYQSLVSNTTDNNAAVGYQSLSAISSASWSGAVGYQACKNSTGSNNVCIGSISDATGGTSTTEGTAIGYGSSVSGANATAIGTNAAASGNKIVLGKITGVIPGVTIPGTLRIGASNFVAAAGIYGTSDRRLKNVGGEFTDGLDKIRKLQPYNFTFKTDKKSTPQVGVMAQDLQKVFPNAVTKSEDGHLLIRKEDMFYAMINSIKQLDKIVQNVVDGLKAVNAKIQTFDKKIIAFVRADQMKLKKIQELEADNKAIEARLAKLEKAAK